jgi:hypothetical protein
MVLPPYTPALQTANDQTRDHLIDSYFKQSFTNKEIILVLLTIHEIQISLAQLKRELRRLGLRRRPQQNVPIAIEQIVRAILRIIENSGQCLGYRTIWKRLIAEGIVVPRNTVMELMRTIDALGVERRRKRRLLRRQYLSPGPNFVWHIDGYDKLKPFGFAIHGAIDGFSRRILWLEVGPTNNDPSVIASYFLDTVQQLGGCPQICRCDLGTENTRIEELQTYFHVSNHTNRGGDCFMYGKSTSNQRIEAWWSVLRRQATDWWITFFKSLRDSRLFDDADPLHIECVRYCFMDVLQDELIQVAVQWNQHTLQVKKDCNSPRGKPDVMYFLPDLYDCQDHKVPCDSTEIQRCKQMYGHGRPLHGCSAEFIQLAQLLVPNAGRPKDSTEAAGLYEQLINAITRYDN